MANKSIEFRLMGLGIAGGYKPRAEVIFDTSLKKIKDVFPSTDPVLKLKIKMGLTEFPEELQIWWDQCKDYIRRGSAFFIFDKYIRNTKYEKSARQYFVYDARTRGTYIPDHMDFIRKIPKGGEEIKVDYVVRSFITHPRAMVGHSLNPMNLSLIDMINSVNRQDLYQTAESDKPWVNYRYISKMAHDYWEGVCGY